MVSILASQEGDEITGVPFLDLKASYERRREEFDRALADTILDTDFVLGPRSERFEHEFAEYCGVEHAVGCGNGTDAIEIAFEAAGIGSGDEVITVAHTFPATVSSIFRVGAQPVLIDVDPDTLLMDGALLEEAITERTAAIVAVHLYGSAVPMDPVIQVARRHGLAIFEDASQAHGARWRDRRAGSLGLVSTFSFYPGKNLGAFGDAGMLLTRDSQIAANAREIRDHGKSSKFEHIRVGRNSRLDGLQAAVLEVKLRYLDEDNVARRVAYARYVDLIRDLCPKADLVAVPEGDEAVHHLAVVRVPRRNEVKRDLAEHGIDTGIHYRVPVHLQPAFSDRVRCVGKLKVTEEACDQILSLPMFPTITEAQQLSVVSALANAVA
jgi:dTDP-4-amino-4,6-dideoxygalactose transaminase